MGNDNLMGSKRGGNDHTKLLLDDLEDLLLIELLGQSLNSGQGLTTIAFCSMGCISHGALVSARCIASKGDRLARSAMRGRP